MLAGAITDAAGNYTIEGNVPVGVEFLLVVKAGKFRRAVSHTLPPRPPARPRRCRTRCPTTRRGWRAAASDGLAVNFPKIAVSTGRIDAMECVFEKMGIARDRVR